MTMQDDIDRQQNNTPFHRFLLANRPYCEFCVGPQPSTKIIPFGRHEKAVCDSHFWALAPELAKKQLKKETNK